MEKRVETARESRPLPRLFGAPDRDSINDVRVNRANRWISIAPHVAYGALSARLGHDDEELAMMFADAIIEGSTGIIGALFGSAFDAEFAIVSIGHNRVHLHFEKSDQCGDFMRRWLAEGAA